MHEAEAAAASLLSAETLLGELFLNSNGFFTFKALLGIKMALFVDLKIDFKIPNFCRAVTIQKQEKPDSLKVISEGRF